MRFKLEDARGFLVRTPEVVRALLTGVPETWASANYGPGTWSPREIVAHLVYGEMTDWVPRTRIILEHGPSKAFTPFDRGGHEPLMIGKSLGMLIDEFTRMRIDRVAELDAMHLRESDLDRAGTHPELGGVTMRHLLAAWVVHDQNHIAQLSKAIACQYKAEVGPWERYMSILAPPNPR